MQVKYLQGDKGKEDLNQIDKQKLHQSLHKVKNAAIEYFKTTQLKDAGANIMET